MIDNNENTTFDDSTEPVGKKYSSELAKRTKAYKESKEYKQKVANNEYVEPYDAETRKEFWKFDLNPITGWYHTQTIPHVNDIMKYGQTYSVEQQKR